jgi:spoIIIJ-associated protein
MVQEFEGRTEKEAIDSAVESLGLERDEFDVEIVDTQKAGFLGIQKKVKIRVHLPGATGGGNNPDPEDDFEHAIVDFIEETTTHMGFPAKAQITYREADKIGIRLESEHSGILIGRKGKNLDALQLLANVVASRLDHGDVKIVLDSENYRSRREESLIRLAHKVGDQVKRTRKSQLLEPMNPFERRLIHTTLNDIAEISTKSEGEGLYKKVKVFYRGHEDD